MAIESDGHSRGNPRIYELIENAPKSGKSPTIWAWPEVVDWLRVAGQPVAGPWPPHQQPRPNPEEASEPVAVVEPERAAPKQYRPSNEPASEPAPRPTERPTYGGVGSADEDRPPRHGLGLLDT